MLFLHTVISVSLVSCDSDIGLLLFINVRLAQVASQVQVESLKGEIQHQSVKDI